MVKGQNQLRGLIALTSMLIACLLLIGEARQKSVPVKPLSAPPIRYFEDHCARCHGSFGSFFGEEFGKELSDEKLQEAVKRMAEGPAGAPLQGESLSAQVAFHRALIRKEPFVAWTGRSVTELWGEVTENAKVQVRFGKRLQAASVKGAEWRVKIPAQASAQTAQVIATWRGKQTTLQLRQGAYSHSR